MQYSYAGGLMVCASVSGSTVRVQALATNNVLCSWARRFTLTVPLFTHLYKRGTRLFNSGGNPAMD